MTEVTRRTGDEIGAAIGKSIGGKTGESVGRSVFRSIIGGFLKRSWRMNDWWWGRLDAAAVLCRTVLDPERL